MKIPLLFSFALVSACGSEVSDNEIADMRRAGQHCVIGGLSGQFVKAVKEQLRDPTSFEHVETAIMPVAADGTHEIAMRFRSRNGFGGMTLSAALGSVDSETCAASVIDVGNQ